MERQKKAVYDFWQERSCGEALYLKDTDLDAYGAQARQRYALEPYIERFAEFSGSKGKTVLEIGVGLGADHQRFAEAGAQLHGIDLSHRAIEHTQRRLDGFGLSSKLAVGDAEHLDFEDSTFDVVYSWGVLHHSPDTPQTVAEVWRVLRPDGEARIMIYHKWSLVGYMLWVRYALLALRPWTRLKDIYARHLESPGTKAYTVREAREMFSAFRGVDIEVVLTHADLLQSEAGQRHRSVLLSVARRLWPRRLLRSCYGAHGLHMLIRAVK